MKLVHAFTRRNARPDVVTDAEATIFTIDAPASLPLPFTTIPSANDLITDAHTRVSHLTAQGGADEYCGDTFDTHYDRWHLETTRTAAHLAGEQRRVDRALVDDAHQHAHTTRAAADTTRTTAERHTTTADQLWNRIFTTT